VLDCVFNDFPLAVTAAMGDDLCRVVFKKKALNFSTGETPPYDGSKIKVGTVAKDKTRAGCDAQPVRNGLQGVKKALPRVCQPNAGIVRGYAGRYQDRNSSWGVRFVAHGLPHLQMPKPAQSRGGSVGPIWMLHGPLQSANPYRDPTRIGI